MRSLSHSNSPLRLRQACLVTSALAVMLGGGCDCSTSNEPDAADVDASVDTIIDAGRDVPIITPPPVDAGAPSDIPPIPHDGGPDDPGWVALPDLPSGCVIERATHPERLLRNEWAPCGPGREYLVRDERFERGINRSGWHDGSRGYFSTNQGRLSEPEETRRRIVVFAATDGEVLGAWRGASLRARPVCAPARVIVGDGYAVLDLLFLDPNQRRENQRRLYYAPIEELGTLDEVTVVLGADIVPPGSVVQRGVVSRHVFAAELQPAGQLLLLRPNGTIDVQPVAGNPQRAHVVGEDVFVDVFDGPTGHIVMHHARFGEGNAPFLARTDAHVAASFATEDHLTWHQAYGPGRISSAERIELWAAPFTRDRELLEPRMVRLMFPGILPGHVSTRFEGSGIRAATSSTAVRLSDGALLRYPRGAGIGDGVDIAGNFGHLWSAGGEVGLHAVLLTGGPSQSTVRRDQIDGLWVETEE